MFQHEARNGLVGNWSPGIGDPTFVGWFTAFAYFFTAYLCYRVYRRLDDSRRDGRQGASAILTPLLLALTARERRLAEISDEAKNRALWLSLAWILLLLGINKQLDLQTALTEIGRLMAFSGGWYGRRRRVQKIFIGGMIIAGCWGLRSVWALMRGQVRQAWPAMLGAVWLVTFVAIRAASFHHVDILLGSRIGGVKLNWALELGGIGLVAWAAYRVQRATAVQRP